MRLVSLECCTTLSFADAVTERNNPTFNGVKLNLNQLKSIFKRLYDWVIALGSIQC
jgi:hypothetical protein